MIAAGSVARFEAEEGGLLAVITASARRGVQKPARVTLPARADGPVRVVDETSGMGIAFGLEGARAVPVTVSEGIALYEKALRGEADVVHRVHAEGTEDYVVFEERPDREEIRYGVDVSAVAGLRLVGNVLEFVDREGTPRLRVAPPYVVDALGTRHEARLGVEGCAYDADPRGPWGRAVMAPGAKACGVSVGWEGVVYPAVVDPAWVATGSMAQARKWHTASGFSTGKVIVTGGCGLNCASVLASAEQYNPTTGIWSSLPDMPTPREYHRASALDASGTLIVTGGINLGTALAATQLYDSTTSKWSTVGSLAQARAHHTASVLPSGKVLIVGGHDNISSSIASAELYDPSTNGWIPAGSLAMARANHTMNVLATGKVFVAGGINSAGTLASAELYDPSTNGWSPAQSMATARFGHTASLLGSGKVLVAGGDNGSGGSLASAALYDPATNTWGVAASMMMTRWSHAAETLGSSKVLVTGGCTDTLCGTVLSSTELYVPSTDTWSTGGTMMAARVYHTEILLSVGEALVVGGESGSVLASAELYLIEAGSPCALPKDCQSGFCADNVCCESACTTDPCHACSIAAGAPTDGTCAPLTGHACPGGTCQSGTCTPAPDGGIDAGTGGSTISSSSSGTTTTSSTSSGSATGGSPASTPSTNFYACSTSPGRAPPLAPAALGGLLLALTGRRRRRLA